MNLSRNQKVLIAALVLTFILNLLASPPPTGLETRPGTSIKSPAWYGVFAVLLGVDVVAVALLFFKPKAASILAAIVSILNFVVVLSDQAGLIQPTAPPSPIFGDEVAIFIVSIVVLLYASMVYKGTNPKTAPPTPAH